jgi:PhnB protein
LALRFKCKEEQQRIFAELSEGGKVNMLLQKAFWSELYGMIIDEF